jgi:hypothetical protein
MLRAHHKLLGALILVAWISSLYLLFPLPGQRIASFVQLDQKDSAAFIEREMKATGLPRADVERVLKLKQERDGQAVWVQWLFVAALLVAGVIAGVMAVRSTRDWPYYVMVTSLLYVIGWVLSFSGSGAVSNGSVLDAYVSSLLNSFLASSSASLLAFLHKDLLLPLFHFFVATFLLYKRWEFSAPEVPQS